MKIYKTIIIFLFILFFSNCRILDLRSSKEPPSGFIYQNIIFNYYTSHRSDLGSKQGKACISSWFNLVSIGDASIRTAAASAAIKEIRAVDYEVIRYLGFVYEKFCLIVQGE